MPRLRGEFCWMLSNDLNMINFITISNLNESKGILYLLDACRMLVQRGEFNFHLHLVGAATAEISAERMEQEIYERKLTTYVTYHGKQYGEQKEKLLAEADVFVHPTLDDCFPLVLLEAMQRALPIIATPVGAIPDIVEDGVNGFLVPERDPEALAQAMKQLMDAPNLAQQMGQRGKEKYLTNYTIEYFEQRLLNIIK